MKYPTVSKGDTRDMAGLLLDGEGIDVELHTVWEGREEELNVEPLAKVADQVTTQLAVFQKSGSKDRDLFEGQVAAELHPTLRDLTVEALDDPGFWRWLTMKYFWDFVFWRESGTFASREFEKYRKYIDGLSAAECVLMRMFLRAQAVVDGDDYSMTSAISSGTDFWRSHILRVRVGASPPVAKAFAHEQATHRMPTGELRSYARRLNRIQTNVVLALYDDASAQALIAGLRAE